jgi:hypothetical protein
MSETITSNDSPERAGNPTPPDTPAVERETILVGRGGPLVVPHEDIGAEFDDGEDLDLGALHSETRIDR